MCVLLINKWMKWKILTVSKRVAHADNTATLHKISEFTVHFTLFHAFHTLEPIQPSWYLSTSALTQKNYLMSASWLKAHWNNLYADGKCWHSLCQGKLMYSPWSQMAHILGSPPHSPLLFHPTHTLLPSLKMKYSSALAAAIIVVIGAVVVEVERLAVAVH